jgi:hypothetical protein
MAKVETKTSDVDRPTYLGNFPADGFDRSALRLHVSASEAAPLRIDITGPGNSWFHFYNTHSLPIRREDGPARPISPDLRSVRELATTNNVFQIAYTASGQAGAPVQREILENPLGSATATPLHPLQNAWQAPFFYGDAYHLFYVTTTHQPHWIPGLFTYVTPWFPPLLIAPPLVVVIPQPQPLPPVLLGGGTVFGPKVFVADPSRIARFLTANGSITRAIGALGNVPFGGSEIGPAGAVSVSPMSHTGEP